jgi:hypothetical protein
MPKIWEKAVETYKKKGIDNPYAYATAVLQKKKILKKGTRELTKKGRGQ